MKTEEQIKLAKEMEKILKDYSELASTCKKLKTQEAKDTIEDFLDTSIQIVVSNIKKL